MNIIGIAGEPATGKTTLVRTLMGRLQGTRRPFQYGRCLHGLHYPRHKLYILGLYPDGETFGGTDRLSTTVHQDTMPFIDRIAATEPEATVVFEGDRLMFNAFLNHCLNSNAQLHLWMLTASEQSKAQRHIDRGDTQSLQWRTGRKTKAHNLLTDWYPWMEERASETPEDTDALVTTLLAWMPLMEQEHE